VNFNSLNPNTERYLELGTEIDLISFCKLKIYRNDFGKTIRLTTGYSFTNAFLQMPFKIGCKERL